MQLFYDVNIIFHITCILCLILGAEILKRVCKKYPYELIPILLVFLSIVVTAVHFNKFQEINTWNIRLMDGMVHGLAAVGLHQTWKQTKRFFEMRKLKKHLSNDKRKNDRVVS